MKLHAIAIGVTWSVTAAAVAAVASGQAKDTPKDARPKATLQARPQISMSPTRVVLSADIVGGPNDFEDFYCPTIQWDWGDDTSSEVTNDCDPYEAGKSEIRRHYSVQHIYRRAGTYQVTFRLKRHERQLTAATATIEVRPGSRESVEQ